MAVSIAAVRAFRAVRPDHFHACLECIRATGARCNRTLCRLALWPLVLGYASFGAFLIFR